MSSFKARPNLSDIQFRQEPDAQLTLSGDTFIASPTGLSINNGMGVYVPIIVSGGTENDVLTLVGTQMILRPSSASGTSAFNSNRVTTRVGIPSINVGGATINEFIEGYFFPSVVPSSSLSVFSGGNDRQFGDAGVGNLSWSVTRNTMPLTSISISSNALGTYNCVVPIIDGNSQSGSASYTISTCQTPATSAVTTTIATYMVSASTSTGETTQTNATIVWRNKKFYFNNSTILTSGTVGAVMTASGGALSTTKTLNISQVLNNEYFYYAYPKTFGIPAFTVNGLPNNAWGNLSSGTLFTVTYVNTNGYSTEFYVARSDNKITGTYNIIVA